VGATTATATTTACAAPLAVPCATDSVGGNTETGSAAMTWRAAAPSGVFDRQVE